MKISMEELTDFVDEIYFKRGKKIIEEGSLILKQVKVDSIIACAIGTSVYKVTLFRKKNALAGNCTCPAFIDFGPCKHLAATGLAYLTPGYKPDDIFCEHEEMFENMIYNLSKQTKETLVNLIVRLIGQDEEMIRIVEDEIES